MRSKHDSVTPALDCFVSALDARIREEVASVPAATPALPLIVAGGKRTRARLLWLAAAASTGRTGELCEDDLLRAGAAIELAHLGSLVHDDIVDAAPTRRGVATLHLRDGATVAFRTGATLLHLSSALIAPLPQRLRRAVSRAVLLTCRGQVRELISLFQQSSPHTRLALVRDKTAAFFDLAALLGAALAGGSPCHETALRRFARCFGIAFQIADDVMDLVGDPRRLGRANGADLREGVMTLPILLAVEACPFVGRLLERARSAGTLDDVAECLRLIERSGAIERAAEESREWLRRAIAHLDVVPPSSARQELLSLAGAVIEAAMIRKRGTCIEQRTGFSGTRLHFALAVANDEHAGPHRPRTLTVDDIVTLRGLGWIDPNLALTVRLLLSHPSSPGFSMQGLSCPHHRDPFTLGGAGVHAFQLAQWTASEERLQAYPRENITMADCLHAVALAHFTNRSSDKHVEVAGAILRTFSARVRDDADAMGRGTSWQPSSSSAAPAPLH